MLNTFKPTFKIKKITEKSDYGKFVLEPLQQGYGHTLGNALRRCLLGSLPGAAITRIQIDGVRHQFSTLPGLKEDIVELVLNLKQIRIIVKDTKEAKITLEAVGPGEVEAKDIKAPAGVEIVNKDLHLATLADKKSKLKIKMWVNSGYGYAPAEEQSITTVGVMPIDAAFTPITKVNYVVEATRVGHRTDFDKLILEIFSNGTMRPKKALIEGAKLLASFFKQIYKPVYEEEKPVVKKDVDEEVMRMTIEELDLPTRISNSLRRSGYETIKDLSKLEISDLAKIKNLGKKSINLILDKLVEKGVQLKEEE